MPQFLLRTAYLEHRANLVRFFTLRLGSAEAAEDLVQDIYIKISDLDETQVQNPGAYLYRIGWNIMLDTLRQRRRAGARDGAWTDAHQSRLANEAIVDAAPADAVVSARQTLERLVEALQALPPQTQKVFRRHKFDGLSHAEVAAELNISRSAVEKHVSTALRHLLGLKP